MKRSLIPLVLLNFVNVLGFAVLIPVLPFMVELYGGNDIVYGVVLSMYPLFQFIGAPILGTLSDVYGRRPLLLLSQAGTVISWLLFALAFFVPNTIVFSTVQLPLVIIMISRITDGLTGGNFSVANAAVADITPRNQKTKIYGFLGAAVGVGLIIGPVIGSYVSSFSMEYAGIAIFSVVLSLITQMLLYLYLPETLALDKRQKKPQFHVLEEINVYRKMRQFKNATILRLFFIRAFFALVFTAYTSTIVLFMKDTLLLEEQHIGSVFLLLGSYFIFNQTVATPYFARKIGNMRTFYIGQICMFIGLTLISFVQSLPVFFVVSYITNFGFAASFPTFKSIITDLVSESRQGEITGVDESILAGASAIAPLVASIVYAGFAATAYPLFALFLIVPHIILFARTGKAYVAP